MFVFYGQISAFLDSFLALKPIFCFTVVVKGFIFS